MQRPRLELYICGAALDMIAYPNVGQAYRALFYPKYISRVSIDQAVVLIMIFWAMCGCNAFAAAVDHKRTPVSACAVACVLYTGPNGDQRELMVSDWRKDCEIEPLRLEGAGPRHKATLCDARPAFLQYQR